MSEMNIKIISLENLIYSGDIWRSLNDILIVKV